MKTSSLYIPSFKVKRTSISIFYLCFIEPRAYVRVRVGEVDKKFLKKVLRKMPSSRE